MRAVADYVTRESSLLSFCKGDVIRVVRDEQYVDKGMQAGRPVHSNPLSPLSLYLLCLSWRVIAFLSWRMERAHTTPVVKHRENEQAERVERAIWTGPFDGMPALPCKVAIHSFFFLSFLSPVLFSLEFLVIRQKNWATMQGLSCSLSLAQDLYLA